MSRHIVVSVTALIMAVMLTVALMLPTVAESSDPVAENFEFQTYRGVSFGGTLSAVDPDGDTVSFEITTKPVKGEIELCDDGSFVYTPIDGKKGRDYFGYKAIDSNGNASQEATVIIKLLKAKDTISYADMQGNSSYYSAVKLAESGAYIGKQIGGEYFFEPQSTLSRGEFLSMCLEVTGADVFSGVVSTGFYDDSDIPSWEKAYVSTAVKSGIVHGYHGAEGIMFDANTPISRAEASVMLNRTLQLSDVNFSSDSDTIPTWAAQAAANLSACDVISFNDAMDTPLTHAEAADMLFGAMNVIDAR